MLPDLPSLVAVTVAVPGATAVTTPFVETVATAPLSMDQVTTRFVTTAPFASLTVGASVSAWPTISAVVAGRVTLPTGTRATLTAADAAWPSIVAVMVALPTPSPVTTPADETEATVASLVDQAIARPESTLPLASLGVADSVALCPIVRLADDGAIATDATGIAKMVSGAAPVFPSTLALMTTGPGAAAPTTPPLVTVAIDVFELDHTSVRPDSGRPLTSSTVAVMVSDCPTVIFGAGEVRTTRSAGAGVTVTVAVPDFPSLVAVIVAVPDVTPVTRPELETVATATLLLDHVTTRPVVTAPVTSRTTAESCVLEFSTTEAVCGCTVTVPTPKLETATLAMPTFPSTVAEIWTVPAATAVTTPVADTVATA